MLDLIFWGVVALFIWNLRDTYRFNKERKADEDQITLQMETINEPPGKGPLGL